MFKQKTNGLMASETFSAIVWSLLVLFGLGAGIATASDQVVLVPAGWTADVAISPVAVNDGVIAVGLYSNTAPTQSLIVIQDGPSSTTTVLPGKVKSLEFSSDGSHLLANAASPTPPKGTIDVTVLDHMGNIVWTKSGRRFFRFSTTGESVYATGGISGLGMGHEVEIFDLAGNSVNHLKFTQGPNAASQTPRILSGFVLIGSGDEALLSWGREIERISIGTNGTVSRVWHQSLDSTRESSRLNYLGADQFSVRMPSGAFRIYDGGGTLRFEFDPDSMLAAFPTRSESSLRKYEPFVGSDPDKLILFNQSKALFSVDLDSGAISEFEDNQLTSSPGSALRRKLSGDRVMLVNSKQVRVRQISVPAKLK